MCVCRRHTPTEACVCVCVCVCVGVTPQLKHGQKFTKVSALVHFLWKASMREYFTEIHISVKSKEYGTENKKLSALAHFEWQVSIESTLLLYYFCQCLPCSSANTHVTSSHTCHIIITCVKSSHATSSHTCHIITPCSSANWTSSMRVTLACIRISL